MDLLTPSYPPGAVVDRHPRLSPSTPIYGGVLDRTSHGESSSRLAEEQDEGGGAVTAFVAVGKSPEKAVGLLQWTFHKFGSCPVGLVHVHQPSPTIPTLLGKLPVSQADAEVVAAFRKLEWENTRKLLQIYLSLCHRRKVKASIVTTEAEQVQIGLIDLISKHRIRKLVMGAVPEKCMKVKRSSSKANYAAKNAPPYCEIWFVHKRRNIWTREAFEDIVGGNSLRSKSLRYDKTESLCYSARIRFNSSRANTSGVKDCIQNIDIEREDDLALSQDSRPLCSSIIKSDQHYADSPFHVMTSTSSRSVCTPSADEHITLDSHIKVEEEMLLRELEEEIMLDPVVAADGHTYEREALSGWLENGRETSPMTNLPLSHLHLAPNHTLRRAIQDWLCKP